MRFLRILGGGILVLGVVCPVAHADGNATLGKAKTAVCAGCHGAEGNGGADPTWPKLAGQDATYLAKQLKDFKTGKRKDATMSGMVAALSDADLQNIAAYYASLKASAGSARDKAAVAKGEKVYRGGNAKTGVSACMSCHGPSGHGIPPRFPALAGQKAAYTKKQMLAFKSGTRSNDGDVMTKIAFRMSEAEIDAVAEYVAGLHEAK
jgi:cbb3-type cytochrome c oxidase subunit III